MRPQHGGDAFWVAKTYGEAGPAAVEAVVAGFLGGTVYATAAPFYDPVVRGGQPGILLRVAVDSAANMASLVAANTPIR
eukprot:1212302-Lingulodinium_polyedra.AAC.1